MNPLLPHLRAPRRAVVAALGVALFSAACEDPFELKAQRETDNLVFQVWSLNSSPDEFPTALNVPAATLVRPDAGGNFDIAFDVGDDGLLRIIPMRLVVTPLIGAHAVSFLETTATFEQVLSAPTTGWEVDSTIALDAGSTFLVRVTPPVCQFQLRQQVYAKFTVDSIDLAGRRAWLRGKLNPNCGFRSFQDGIPEF